MTGLSRRQFLHVAAAAAAATGIGLDALSAASARAAAAPAALAAGIPTTLQQTIRQGSLVSGRYRALTTGPGEPYLPRTDVLRRAPSAARTAPDGRCCTSATCPTCTSSRRSRPAASNP